MSAKVNGKNVPIKYTLNNDSVSVITASPAQSQAGLAELRRHLQGPCKDQAGLEGGAVKAVEFAKEMLQRRFQNRKIDMDEPTMMRYIKKKGFKARHGLLHRRSPGTPPIWQVIDEYLWAFRKENETNEHAKVRKRGENY